MTEPRAPGSVPSADVVKGRRYGDAYIRIRREVLGSAFRRGAERRLVATDAAGPGAGRAGLLLRRVKRYLIGRPLDSESMENERLSIFRALPILSSDALSSVAYGPEAGLAVLATAGAGALIWNVPIGIAITILMAIVTASYRQVIRGYQGGGGSYAVARANLGTTIGLVAAGALLVDYVLTVSVSVSSGVDAMVSAVGGLAPYAIPLGLVFIALLIVGNLRGVREAGVLFAGPTYLFLVCMTALIVVGLVRALVFGAPDHPPGQYAPIRPQTALAPLLILTAFASGSSSMTGIEAVSNSVPSFERPEAANAIRTLTLLGVVLIVLFAGVVALDVLYGAEPHSSGNPTVLSELADSVFQGPTHPVFYAIQFATLLVLVLAANTSFNGFPRLSAILAQDGFLPRRFAQLGNRLVYSTSIFLLAIAAAALNLAFNGNTDALINLYALGVFTAFTLAQSAMVRQWWRTRGPGWRRGMVINGFGALVTAVVDGVIIVTKSPRGAWVVLVIIPALILLFALISRYYASVASALAAVGDAPQVVTPGPAVVPVFGWGPATRTAIAYAQLLPLEPLAVHVAAQPAASARFERAWEELWPARTRPQLRPLVAPPGRRIRAFLSVLDEICEQARGAVVTVVLPEPAGSTFARQLVRHPGLLWLKLQLVLRPDVVAASLPALTAASPLRTAIVPLANLGPPVRRALAYAVALSTEVLAVHVEGADAHRGGAEALRDKLEAWKAQLEPRGGLSTVRFVVIESPYRAVVPPLLAYIDVWRQAHPEPLCTVVLPEFVGRGWGIWLHNHRAFWLKAALLTRRGVAVADATYHLR